MLKINPNPTFKVKVPIVVPGGPDASFIGEFKHKGKNDLAAYFSSMSVEGNAHIKEILVGWSDIDIDFSSEAIDRLCDTYYKADEAIISSYIDELTRAVEKKFEK